MPSSSKGTCKNPPTMACEHRGCKTLPSYAKKGIPLPTHCEIHKSAKMVLIPRMTCILGCCRSHHTYDDYGKIFCCYCGSDLWPEADQ
jgi:hypothetical protein